MKKMARLENEEDHFSIFKAYFFSLSSVSMYLDITILRDWQLRPAGNDGHSNRESMPATRRYSLCKKG